MHGGASLAQVQADPVEGERVQHMLVVIVWLLAAAEGKYQEWMVLKLGRKASVYLSVFLVTSYGRPHCRSWLLASQRV